MAWELAHVVQPALKVGSTDDPLERDAEQFAGQACCGSETDGGSSCAECRQRAQEPLIQRRTHGRAHPQNGGAVHGIALGPGRPLGAAQRSFFEPRVGGDLGGVRVHTDSQAGQAAERLGARAFTVGSDIAFAPAEYHPDTGEGQRLLAHEIAHVVQQRSADPRVLRRQPRAKLPWEKRMRQSGPVDWKPGMRATLISDIDEEDHVAPGVWFKGGSLVEVLNNPGIGNPQVQLLDPKARTKKPFYIDDLRLEPVGPAASATQERAQTPSAKPPASKQMRHSGPVAWKPGMRAALVAEYAGYDDYGRAVKVKAGSLVEVVNNPGFGRIGVQLVDPTARTKKPLYIDDLRLEPVGPTTPASTTGSPADVRGVPVMFQYEVLDPAAGGPEPSSGTGWGAAGARSTAIGAARGLGYLISPPVRGPFDPLLPLASRLSQPPGPLGVAGDTATLERYLTSPAGELTPRYAAEQAELFMRQSHNESWWLNNFGINERQLGELQGLVARMAEGGMESLAPTEQQLMMTFLRAHAESVAAPGLKIASPALSTTAREGLSALPEAAPFFRRAPYVVRMQVPANAVVDVNATMGARRMPGLVYEAEMLVFTDARGAITSVRPNPVSTLGRAAPVLKGVGYGFLIIGIGLSAHRISTATPEELPRVIGEEGGGWAGGLGGSALVAGACIAFGIATEGIGLFLCGAVGGIGGGLGGSYLGGELGEGLGKKVRGSMETAGEVFNPMIERAIWGNTSIPPLGYYPPREFGRNPMEYEEEREREMRSWSSSQGR